MQRHAQAPERWTVDLANLEVFNQDGIRICELDITAQHGNQILADAALIAAAPELLHELRFAHAALQNALNIMTNKQKVEWCERNVRWNESYRDGCTGASNRKEAIIKAGGIVPCPNLDGTERNTEGE
jgi:hypothetical protein